MKNDDFVSKSQIKRLRQSETTEKEMMIDYFKVIEVRIGICAAAIFQARLG